MVGSPFTRPISRAMATAVLVASPVIIIIFIPASPHLLMASETSGLGGSSSPINPANTQIALDLLMPAYQLRYRLQFP